MTNNPSKTQRSGDRPKLKPEQQPKAKKALPDVVDEASQESFPASDPPAWTAGEDK